MSAEVVKFYPANAADNPDNVLEQAMGDFDAAHHLAWSMSAALHPSPTTPTTGDLT